MEAARQEDVRQALIWEEATRASSLAAEAAKLAAVQALADAGEHEHRMPAQAAMALKVEQDKELDSEAARSEGDISCLDTQRSCARHCQGTECPTHCRTRPHTRAGITRGARNQY